METMLKLGPLEFKLGGITYDEFVQTLPIAWAEQPRINRRSAFHFVGIGAEIIYLRGCLFPNFDPFGTPTGINRVREVEDMAKAGIPYLLVDGTGRRYGYFIILSVEDARSLMHTNGAPRKQDFALELARYGEDNLKEEAMVSPGAWQSAPTMRTDRFGGMSGDAQTATV